MTPPRADAHRRAAAAERQRRARARRRESAAVVVIELPIIAVTEALADAGRLAGNAVDDRVLVSAALRALLLDWTEAVTRDGVDPVDVLHGADDAAQDREPRDDE